jgi:hypothetical protein
MFQSIDDGLIQLDSYVGYFNLTYSSLLKTYLSFILVNFFIKCKTIVISGHDDHLNIEEDENIYKQIFEENGFTCKSIPSSYYGLFLSYKIERKVYDGFESDTDFALNSLTRNVIDISEFTLRVEKTKFEYLSKAKAGSLHLAGITNLSPKTA